MTDAQKGKTRGQRERGGLRVRGIKQALEHLPPDLRREARREIMEMFKNFDPKNMPGDRILPVPPGTTACPQCRGRLVRTMMFEFPKGMGMPEGRFSALDCEQCDATFVTPVQ